MLPIHVVCNTSDEEIFANIRENSARNNEWLNSSPAHDRVAVLCGSGPSLADTLSEIEAWWGRGAMIFAMNGAAQFLFDHRIVANYQVIIDARPETAQLVGPAHQHLFASQVSPACFEREPNAILWHLQVTGIDDYLPEEQPAHVLIGGAASVGNTATCLAYAMGFRNMHLYGYDSSRRAGKGHAFDQPMNDGDPMAIVNFNGKEYEVSLTMKLQAEKFQETSRALISMGCTIEVHGDGLLPDMFRAPKEVLAEAEKYERMWRVPGYRDVSPGEACVETFFDVARPSGTVIDFGCGTGRAALRLHEQGLDVLLVDFAENSRDEAAMVLPFLQHDLTESLPIAARFGFCTDVMEHIPPEDVDAVLRNIMAAVEVSAFFQISTVPDQLGAMINQSLHLTVRPHEWWRDLFVRLGLAIAWERRGKISSAFHVEHKEAING